MPLIAAITRKVVVCNMRSRGNLAYTRLLHVIIQIRVPHRACAILLRPGPT